jgi:hypothetical protein
MKLPRILLIAAAGASVGFFLGRSGEATLQPGPPTAPKTTKARPAGSSKEPSDARTLAGLIDAMRKARGLPDGMADAAARLSGEALRGQLLKLAAMEIPGAGSSAPAAKWRAALDALADELFLREGEEAIVWAESTGDPDLTVALLRAAGSVDPHLVKRWMPRLAPTWEPNTGWRVFTRVFEAAAQRGAEATLEAERLFPDAVPTTPLGYPAEFDFAGYLAKTESRDGRANAIRAMATRDPEAAAGMLLERVKSVGGWMESRDGSASCALDGVAASGSDSAVVAWVESLAESLPADQRGPLLTQLIGPETRRELAKTLVSGLSTAEARMAVVAGGLRASWQGGMEEFIGALPNPEERREAVALWWRQVPGGMREPNRSVMARAIDAMDLPAAEKAALKAEMRGE